MCRLLGASRRFKAISLSLPQEEKSGEEPKHQHRRADDGDQFREPAAAWNGLEMRLDGVTI
ncbi:MAG: hypothetical protein LC785_16620 [Acidobacteria bacterium]|nr:hypothetical protein [Acidobacteriota bacterium]